MMSGRRAGGRRGSVRGVAVLTVGMLVAAACGGSGGRGGDDAGDDDTAASPSDDTASADALDNPRWANVVSGPEAADGEPVTGGRIVVGLDAEVTTTYHPREFRGGPGFNVAYAIFDPLVTRDAAGELRPYLAESIESNEDFTEWTLRLRPGIRFHDGTPLNAEALKQNWDVLTSEGSVTSLAAQIVEEMEVVDELTVTYSMVEPRAAFPELLELPLGWPFSPDAADRLGDGFGQQPVGTGPFKFVSWRRDGDFVVERNDDYWQAGLPYLDEITFRPIPDETTRAAALGSGDVDAVLSRALSSFVAEVADLDDVEVVLGLGNVGRVAVFNTTRPPTDDRRIRQALAHAVDHELLVDVAAGEAAELSEIRTQFYPMGSPFYSEAVADAALDHDTERARALYEEYVGDPDRSDGKDVGEPVSITLNSSNVPSIVELATAYQGFYEEIGFEVDLQPLDQTTPALIAGEFHVQLSNMGDNRSPLGEFLFYFEGPDIVTNFTNYHDDTIADIIRRLRRVGDLDQQAALTEEMGLHLAREVPFQWLGSDLPLFGAKESVRGLRSWVFPDGTLGDGVSPGTVFWSQVWLDG